MVVNYFFILQFYEKGFVIDFAPLCSTIKSISRGSQIWGGKFARMNIANRLTLVRILMIPFFMVCLLYGDRATNPVLVIVFRYMAFLVFIAASVTDVIDGRVARKYNIVTNFGRLLDPLADKLIVTVAFIGFVEMGIFPAWIVILILCREFVVTGLRMLGVSQGRIIHADKWGKHKTVSQVITIIATLIFICARATLQYTGDWDKIIVRQMEADWWYLLGLRVLLYYCAVLTLFSGAMYLYRNRDLIQDS